MTHKFGVIAMPFAMWRIIARGHVHSPEEYEAAMKAQQIIAQQVATQSFHANCGSPSFITRSSRQHPDSFELVVTCDCGEELTVIDGLDKGSLEAVGESGAFQPLTTHQA